MADSFLPVNLTAEEEAILRACRKDGKPPHELTDASIHERLQSLGLLDHRVGPAPDGDGIADYWSTNGNGEWALSVLDRRRASPRRTQ